MSPDNLQSDALRKLRAIAKLRDPEQAHLDADRVLCDLLIDLGYAAVVTAYGKVGKWYA